MTHIKECILTNQTIREISTGCAVCDNYDNYGQLVHNDNKSCGIIIIIIIIMSQIISSSPLESCTWRSASRSNFAQARWTRREGGGSWSQQSGDDFNHLWFEELEGSLCGLGGWGIQGVMVAGVKNASVKRLIFHWQYLMLIIIDSRTVSSSKMKFRKFSVPRARSRK